MSQSLSEALRASGIVEVVKQQAVAEKEAGVEARRERNSHLLPHQRWWQNFRLTLTPFEIPVFIKVQCEQWNEGLGFIRTRSLNKVTTRCRTKEEAVDQLRTKIAAWQSETQLQVDVEPPAGTLL